MAPAEWICELCTDILLDPLTLPCCGESFCKTCLQQWTVVKLEEGAPQARCPSGCGKQIDYRLPGVSKLLRSFLESAHATELDERRKDQEPEEAMPGGFDLWQEIAASRDLFVCGSLAVAFGSSGIVLAKSEEDRVKVKFDSFVRGASGVFNVSPEEIMPQLPSSFGVKIGQRVVAALDLVVRGAVAIPFATLGTVLGAGSSPDRITVLFDSAAEGFPSRLDIQAFEIAPSQELIGGYKVAQRVKASEDILSQDQVLVKQGSVGMVLSQYSDTRLTVKFEDRLDGRSEAVNLVPAAIEPS